MSDRSITSRKQWPPSSSTTDCQRPHVRFSGNSQWQHARFSPEVHSNSHDVQQSPFWSASGVTVDHLHPTSRPYRKRVRAEDLWDRDEEELLLQRHAKGFASNDCSAESRKKDFQPDFPGSSELGQLSYSVGDDACHGGLVEDRVQAYTRPEADTHNHAVYAEDSIPSGCPEIQSNQQAYTRPESDGITHARKHISPRPADSQSHPNLKRPRGPRLYDFNTGDGAQLEPQKRKRNSAGYTVPSTLENNALTRYRRMHSSTCF